MRRRANQAGKYGPVQFNEYNLKKNRAGCEFWDCRGKRRFPAKVWGFHVGDRRVRGCLALVIGRGVFGFMSAIGALSLFSPAQFRIPGQASLSIVSEVGSPVRRAQRPRATCGERLEPRGQTT